jgi:hypothetical protein
MDSNLGVNTLIHYYKGEKEEKMDGRVYRGGKEVNDF